MVAGIGLVTYLLLASIVKRGSDTIRRQQRELERRLEQNSRLHERVRQAAGRTTALNEQALRRISADLHDGPGQALSLALLRLDALQAPCPANAEGCIRTRADFETVHTAVRDALTDLRAISAGLRLPELERLTVSEVALRAIDDHQRRSGVSVQRRLESLPDQAPLAIKIALLRTLQEALSNATRHGKGADVQVELDGAGDRLRLRVSDHGPGFDTRLAERSGGLGLAGMRERAELLGGAFEVDSAVGVGTTVQACWPLSVPDRGMSDSIRVVVADDHPLFREGVITSLRAVPDVDVVGEAQNAEEAVRVVRDELPDVVLLDVTMPGGGIEAARKIASACPATRIVMLTVSEDEDDLLEAMKAGASGYVLKGVSARELASVVRSVSAGEVYVAPTLAFGLLREMSKPRSSDPLAELSSRERQVLELVANGLSNQEIGLKLGLAEKTIKHYMTNILTKLQVRSRVEAALLAARVGLGQPGSNTPPR